MLSILKVTTVEYSDVQADCVSDAEAGILEATRYVDTCNLTFFTRLKPTTYMSQSRPIRFTTRLLSLIKQLLTIGMEAFMTFQQSKQTVKPWVNFVWLCRRGGRERRYRRGRGGASVISRQWF